MAPTVKHGYPLGLYHSLGVPQDASIDLIKRQYRTMAKIWHPDKNTTRDTTKEFQTLAEAYCVLSNPATRLQYDNQLREINSTPAKKLKYEVPPNGVETVLNGCKVNVNSQSITIKTNFDIDMWISKFEDIYQQSGIDRGQHGVQFKVPFVSDEVQYGSISITLYKATHTIHVQGKSVFLWMEEKLLNLENELGIFPPPYTRSQAKYQAVESISTDPVCNVTTDVVPVTPHTSKDVCPAGDNAQHDTATHSAMPDDATQTQAVILSPPTLITLAKHAISGAQEQTTPNNVTPPEIMKLETKYVNVINLLFDIKKECNAKYTSLSKELGDMKIKYDKLDEENKLLQKTVSSLSKTTTCKCTIKDEVQKNIRPAPIVQHVQSDLQVSTSVNETSLTASTSAETDKIYIPTVKTSNRFDALLGGIKETEKQDVKACDVKPHPRNDVSTTKQQTRNKKQQRTDVVIIADKHGSDIIASKMYTKNRCNAYTLKGSQDLRDARLFVEKTKVTPRVVVFFIGSTDTASHALKDVKFELNNLINETRAKWNNADIFFLSALPELSGKDTVSVIKPISDYNEILREMCEMEKIHIIDISGMSGNETFFTTQTDLTLSGNGLCYLVSKIKNAIHKSVFRNEGKRERKIDINHGNKRWRSETPAPPSAPETARHKRPTWAPPAAQHTPSPPVSYQHPVAQRAEWAGTTLHAVTPQNETQRPAQYRPSPHPTMQREQRTDPPWTGVDTSWQHHTPGYQHHYPPLPSKGLVAELLSVIQNYTI